MPGGVLLADGEYIPGATVVCTVGTKPNPLVKRLAVPTQRGRIETAPDLSVAGLPHVWAIGDCALVRNGMMRRFAPPTAQFAVAQARAGAQHRRLHRKPGDPAVQPRVEGNDGDHRAHEGRDQPRCKRLG